MHLFKTRLVINKSMSVQEFEIEAGSELVSRDPRIYKMSTIIRPPPYAVKFTDVMCCFLIFSMLQTEQQQLYHKFKSL